MKILVINTGSSSVKYQLFDMEHTMVMASGLIDRIGEASSNLTYSAWPRTAKEQKVVLEKPIPDHQHALNVMVAMLTDPQKGVIRETREIAAVGHRVVHGGESFHHSTIIDEKIMEVLRSHIPLAPLHNPANLTGIEVSMKLFSEVPQVGVFDTAFHQTIPPHAFHYALPHELYKKHHVRRYGFHGTSHRYVAKQAAVHFNRSLETLNLITLHLGNGASMTAIENGKSVDTSMGMTPLEGLIMGTRCGDVDPAIHNFLAEQENLSMKEIDSLMNKQSGLKGICGMNDMRDILAKRKAGDPLASLAVDMYCYRIKKYIGAYCAVLGKVHAIVFTGGIGENAAEIRQAICQNLGGLGIHLDLERNKEHGAKSHAINTSDSPVQILVIATNEELEIAQQTWEVIENQLDS
ncbi:acetate kinase [Deltaproteobacteria bacterium TL4]